jgi:hypothetical protein
MLQSIERLQGQARLAITYTRYDENHGTDNEAATKHVVKRRQMR